MLPLRPSKRQLRDAFDRAVVKVPDVDEGMDLHRSVLPCPIIARCDDGETQWFFETIFCRFLFTPRGLFMFKDGGKWPMGGPLRTLLRWRREPCRCDGKRWYCPRHGKTQAFEDAEQA